MRAKTAERETVMDVVLQTTNPIMDHVGWDKDSCIMAGRLALAVLRAAGIRAFVLPVRVDIFNPPYRRLAEQHGRGPENEEEAAVWRHEHNARVVSICGEGEPLPGRWRGHLVVVIEDRLLMDLTLRQVNSDERDIHLGPAFFEVPAGFLQGSEPVVIQQGDCVLGYRVDRDNIGYRFSPDWREEWRLKKLKPLLTAEVERALKKARKQA